MSYFGMTVVCVEPGHVVKDPRTGEEMVVDDQNAVRNGDAFYVTAKVYEALKARAAPAPEEGKG